MRNANSDTAQKNTKLTPETSPLTNNLNHSIATATILTAQQAATTHALLSINRQAYGGMLTNHACITPKTVFGSRGKTCNKTIINIKVAGPMPPTL
uniref:Uncharacterized protein n=1 Tax=Romanomermis culicivorax TaxID=13658 RepID=A0A915HU17_ROMCU